MLSVMGYFLFLALMANLYSWGVTVGLVFVGGVGVALLFGECFSYGGLSMIYGGDCFSVALGLLSVWVMGLVLLSSKVLLEGSGESKLFVSLCLSLLLFLLVSFFTCDLFCFYIFFEVGLFPLLVIVVGYGANPERLQAGLYMLFYTVFGSLPLLVGLVYLMSDTGSLNFVYLVNSDFLGGVLWLGLLMAFLIKLPMFLVHLWLPSAHVEAPVSGSMVLAGVMLKLGGYGLYRVAPFIAQELLRVSPLVLSMGLIGGFLSSLFCLRQSDLKALVAYSSVGHMGLLLGGYSTMNSWGVSGGLVMMVAHGLTSSGLFCLVNMLYERLHTRSLVLIRGLMLVYPSLGLWFFLLSVSNMAAPPFLNLVGELYLSFSMIMSSCLALVPLGGMFFLGAGYSLYVFSMTQHGRFWSLFSLVSLSTREYLLLMSHVLPLLLFVLSLDLLA